MFALVQPNNIVAQTEVKPFPMHSDFQWIECDDTVKPGYTWDGSKFAAPVIPEVIIVEKPKVDPLLDAVIKVILGDSTVNDLSKVYDEAKK